ncbi:hypothetical protein BAUCODRAFT_153621 [Baudoinia panamericana UAMH 10762]|uniref:Uncharacterized protein n=1 Tax=Baudoinia panamericana (strain UAMH 10762) TaxID=717646 RepID=M2M2H3_BAUPA|nr:uncharacterized protein BAUCODRAFT_153621 [Baudoinia panamericana UAMH 10762]EMD01313.1 hypothetical protein BAUCODRAFT_153621 [Baudoinia panamericana UAMH 10762]
MLDFASAKARLSVLKLGRRQSAPLATTLLLEEGARAANENDMCRFASPYLSPREDWSKPKLVDQELLVPAESAAGVNMGNPKVLAMLGITEVLRFDMVQTRKLVLLAK